MTKSKKTDKKKTIFSSVKTLNLLKNWPDNISIKNCPAGIISCRIRPDGQLCLCGWKADMPLEKKIFKAGDLKKEFERLKVNNELCRGCCCAPRIEFSNVWELNLYVLFELCFCGK